MMPPREGGGGDGAIGRSSQTGCRGRDGWRHVAQRGGEAFRGQYRQRRPLVASLRGHRRDFAGSHGRGSPLGPHRGASFGAAGAKAIAVEETGPSEGEAEQRADNPVVSVDPTPEPGSDPAAAIDRPNSGWLPHTTRAALTGLRKRGY